jgi:hypothetical protein
VSKCDSGSNAARSIYPTTIIRSMYPTNIARGQYPTTVARRAFRPADGLNLRGEKKTKPPTKFDGGIY